MEIKVFRGLKNVTSPERFAAKGYLDVAENVDVDDTGKVLTRQGVAQALAGSYHSLWSEEDMCLMGDLSGNLLRVNADYSTTALTRLTTPRRLSFNRQQNTVYFSNGVDKGRLYQGRVRQWGMTPPIGQPKASATGGNLPAGRYQYALTFRRASGTESGTGIAGVIELPGGTGVQFSSIESSPDPEVVEKLIYMSGPNGEELFRVLRLDNSASSASVYDLGLDPGVRLETMFDNPPPAGDIVENYNGVMYVVSGSVAWYSKPYQFERFCYRDQFLQFPGQITLFGAVNDGIYVGTSSTVWFLSGKTPQELTSKVVFDYGAIPGTQTKTTLSVLKSKDEADEGTPSGTALIWATPKGICFGSEGGNALNMTEADYSLPASPRGAAIVRQNHGYTQYLVALEGVLAASDAYQ